MVVEPPGRAELQLARDAPVLEGAGHHGEFVVPVGVEGVKHGPRELSPRVEEVEEGRQGPGDIAIAYRVVARVGAEAGRHAGIHAAQGAHVELHGPAAPRVHGRDLGEEAGFEAVGLARGEARPRAEGGEGRLQLARGKAEADRQLEGVVREAAAEGVEGLVAGVEGLDEGGVGGYPHAGGLLEEGEVGAEGLALLRREGLVGPEGGDHDRLPRLTRARITLMPAQVVGRDRPWCTGP